VISDASETVKGRRHHHRRQQDAVPRGFRGRYLGVGNKLVVLPYEALRVDGTKLTLAGASKETLKDLPEFNYASK
jgi:hypothetical protein